MLWQQYLFQTTMVSNYISNDKIHTLCQINSLAAIFEFEEIFYTFPEGSDGSICLTISNSVTIDTPQIFNIVLLGNSRNFNNLFPLPIYHKFLLSVGSCLGSCGGSSGENCFCDEACTSLGDCCYDVFEHCPCKRIR